MRRTGECQGSALTAHCQCRGGDADQEGTVADNEREEFGHCANNCQLSSRTVCVCRMYTAGARVLTAPQRSTSNFL